jgi:glycosyltransferase involved in cell wall biosynthesis
MNCPTIEELPDPPKGKAGWPWTEGCQSLSAQPRNNKKWPSISIVTPSYNQGQFIEETIRSVLLQGYPKLEYIIIDGGSTDNTIEIIRKYETWLDFWVSEKDRGQSHAINKGWERSSGLIIAWLNSDDVYAFGAFSAVASEWCRYDSVHMLFGDAVSTDVRLQPYKKKNMGSYSLKVMLAGKRMPQPAVFISKELYSRLGPLNESLYFSLDFDFFLRAWMSPEARNFYYISQVLAFSRRYKETKCQAGGHRMIDENVVVLQKNWDKYMRSYHDSKEWRYFIAKAYINLAQRYIKNGDIIKAVRLQLEALKWSFKTIFIIAKEFPRQLFKTIFNRPSMVSTHTHTSKNVTEKH